MATNRPTFPARAVITAGMPYGNKDLHFGHVGGVFVHADAFARFLRDRIGSENVVFVSGTDCYGSPIVEDHRLATERGEFRGSLEDYVRFHHGRQKETLAAYHVAPDLFAASALEPWVGVHRDLGAWILRTLHAHGHLAKRTTAQFYDARRQIFLNGRQVQGRCPIQGCKSEKAYADECSLGHQYEPRNLIAPRSMLSDEPPEMRDVTNWYLDLPALRPQLEAWVRGLREALWRPSTVSAIEEYLEPPVLHITKDQAEKLGEVAGELPRHRQQEGQAKSLQLVFDALEDREKAQEILGRHAIRSRAGKTLVPFRLTGNLEWGLPAPELEGLAGLTFWVWPESLWAPISFTASVLEGAPRAAATWRDWWCTRSAQVFQFIGEDNVFFYSLPQLGMFLGLQGPRPAADAPEGQIQPTRILANHHLLFLDKKASSSGAVKPPMARELLDHYTADQLRAHFLGLGLGSKSVSFQPKPLDPKATERTADPVLKEGNLLSNALNRAARSCFYTAQKYFAPAAGGEGRLPPGPIGADVLAACEESILAFERAMHAHEFHQAMNVAGEHVRQINQRWTQSKASRDDCDPEVRRQVLADTFHQVRVAAVLLHPIAPEGTERIREYLRGGPDFWSWGRIFEPIHAVVPGTLQFLEPRVDFFPKHASQVAAGDE